VVGGGSWLLIPGQLMLDVLRNRGFHSWSV
jgi:hypothetical protein